MNRIAMLRWLGTGALGLGLVAGCSQSRPTVASSSSTPVACASCDCRKGCCQGTAVAQSPVARNVPMYTSAATVPAPSYGAFPAPRPSSSIVQTSAAVATKVPDGPTADLPAPPPPALKSPFTRGETTPARKSFVDITASACFSHAEDYSTVTGQLEHVRANNTWKLRYLSVDESDAYGGSVTLSGDTAQMSAFKDGQYIRVQGHLCNPDQKSIAPAYRFETIQALDNSN